MGPPYRYGGKTPWGLGRRPDCRTAARSAGAVSHVKGGGWGRPGLSDVGKVAWRAWGDCLLLQRSPAAQAVCSPVLSFFHVLRKLSGSLGQETLRGALTLIQQEKDLHALPTYVSLSYK